MLLRVERDAAVYHFNGDELYVRAVVRSDKPAHNAPSGGFDREEAWCQPVGW